MGVVERRHEPLPMFGPIRRRRGRCIRTFDGPERSFLISFGPVFHRRFCSLVRVVGGGCGLCFLRLPGHGVDNDVVILEGGNRVSCPRAATSNPFGVAADSWKLLSSFFSLWTTR